VEGGSIRLADEVRISSTERPHHDGRIITIGRLVLFSTETGDAWLLDSAAAHQHRSGGKFQICLARLEGAEG